MMNSIKKDGRWNYTYDTYRNGVRVTTDFDINVNDKVSVPLNYRDTRTGSSVDLIIADPVSRLDRVIGALHNRRFDEARVIAQSTNVADEADNWVEVWKKKRCLHLGLPNKAAMLLLTGLRKRVGITFAIGQNGDVIRENHIRRICQAGLVDMVDAIPKKRRAGFVTNHRGYNLLVHWAETRKGFGPFLDAYCPKDWEQEYLAKRVFDKIAMHTGPFQEA